MNKIKKMMEGVSLFGVLNMVLFVLAVISGGGAMAADLVTAQVGDEAPDPTSKSGTPDVAERTQSTTDATGAAPQYAPGDIEAGEDYTGSQMSSTQQRKAGNVDDEWDSQTAKFHAFKSPLFSLTRKVARTVNIKNWTVMHSRSGGDTLEASVISDITGGSTITLTRTNVNGNLLPFYKGTSILVPSVQGYAMDGTTKSGCLELFVTEVSKAGITCQAVNGPLASGVTAFTGNLDELTCPDIPAGAKLLASASAGSESQLEITPENYQPSKYEIFVQKKILNLLFTEDFKEVKRKQPHYFNDVRADAIDKYKLRAERNYWMGNKKRFSIQMDDGSIEDVYKSDGILNQVTYSYAIGDEYTLNDLIALTMLQFTNFSEHDHAYAFCGKNASAKLLNVNPGTNRHVEIQITQMAGLDIEFHRFKDTFGTIDFCYCQTLDLLGMEDCMVILDLEGATRYLKIGEKEQTNDLSKGQGARLAKRWIHYEADAIALRGYNSIIVGPADKIYSLPASENRSKVISTDVYPTTVVKDMVVAFKVDYEAKEDVDGVKYTFEAGKVYQCTNATTGSIAWEPYTGKTFAV